MKFLILFIHLMLMLNCYSQDNSFNLFSKYYFHPDKVGMIDSTEIRLPLFDSIAIIQKINFDGVSNFYKLKKVGMMDDINFNALIKEENDKFIIFNTHNINENISVKDQLITISIYEKSTQNIIVFRVLDKKITSYSILNKIPNGNWHLNNYYLSDNTLKNEFVKIEKVLGYIEKNKLYANSLTALSNFYKMEINKPIDYESISWIIW